MRKFKLIGAFGAFVVAAMTVFACSDDSSSANNTQNPFVPVDAAASTTPTGDAGPNGDSTTDGGCPNKPAGCFCGTPTTQKEFLNRCTEASAVKVVLEPFTPATTLNIP